MRAIVIDKPGDVCLGEVPDPTPGPEEIVVAVGACGICGTDLHIVDGEFSLAAYPLVPGHEFAGEVVAAGRAVEGIEVGATVTVDPNQYCGRCRPCREGHGNLCERFKALGVTVGGGCAEYTVVPYWLARPLPFGFDMAVGALVEPLSCVIHAYDLLNARLGDRFLIYGAGTMGLMLCALAPRGGAASVTMVEPHKARRDLALAFGAGTVVRTSDDLGDERFDVVIDASGLTAVIEEALRHVQRGGRYLQFGVAPSEAMARFSPYRLYNDELTYLGSMAVLRSFDRACDIAVQLGELGLGRLVSDTFRLDEHDKAFRRARTGGGLKIQLSPGAAR